MKTSSCIKQYNMPAKTVKISWLSTGTFTKYIIYNYIII